MHAFMPVHGLTACGAFQRSSPTGGAAKGMPLKICTDPSPLTVPEICPASVLTTSNVDCARVQQAHKRVKDRLRMRFIIKVLQINERIYGFAAGLPYFAVRASLITPFQFRP